METFLHLQIKKKKKFQGRDILSQQLIIRNFYDDKANQITYIKRSIFKLNCDINSYNIIHKMYK